MRSGWCGMAVRGPTGVGAHVGQLGEHYVPGKSVSTLGRRPGAGRSEGRRTPLASCFRPRRGWRNGRSGGGVVRPSVAAMRSLLRIAVAPATLLVLGMAVAPGTAYAMDGDERIARIRLRVVEAVNEKTRDEIQRAHACPGSHSADEVDRLEAKLRDGCRLAQDLRHVRAAHGRGRAVHAVGGGSGDGPGAPGDGPGAPGGPGALADGPSGSRGGPGGSGGGGADADVQGSVFQAARAELPRLPVGVLSLVGGGALALVGGGMAAVAVGWLPRR
ncbi:hypothetical protein DWB77_03429 [Streptomyces hundungensis]|uniref:Uncharacterized protein n=2 Tax=Streptomyces hundungensis TaxID=1077946 RepID=A0A387HG78_9ACTN|nr:hypothetical protein DWB77_03429 [Streptomyces hundungensis]